MRTDAKKAAYAAGIDPNAWVGDAFEAVGDVGAAYLGGKGGGVGGQNKTAGAGGGEGIPEPTAGAGGTKMNPMLIVGVVVLAVVFFMFKKK
jgi:hypothetical protein